MKLSEAIKKVVDSESSEVLVNHIFLNFIQDYQGFEECSAAKYILKTMIDEGFMDRIKFVYDTNGTWEDKIASYSQQLKSSYGFKDELVDITINALMYAFGWEFESDNHLEVDNASETESSTDDDSTGKYFTFKGVEINGNLQSIVRNLNKKGFVIEEQTPEGTSMVGTFAGITDCHIYISVSQITGLSSKVLVIAARTNNWYSAKSEYSRLKDMLSQKYEELSKWESFDSPYYEGDGYELSAINCGRGRYFCNYGNDLGTITLMITGEGTILMQYEDNSIKAIEEKGVLQSADEDL